MSDAVVRTEGLTKRYGKLTAVDGAVLDVPEGKVFALMGRNGAGKTTLIRMLLGLTPPTAGRATVLGLDSERQHVEIRRRVGYVPETHHMYAWMTVAEVARFTSAFYPTWNDKTCAGLLDRFGLDRGKRIKELSKGMVAKVALTLALAHEPRLLVLDEPTSGLDAVVRKEFLESIIGVAADEGRTVVISSHLLNDVERATDRVALMDQGRVRLVEDMESLKTRMREVKATFSPGAAPEKKLDWPGLVSLKQERQEWLMVLQDFGPATLAEVQRKLPGATLEPRVMSLEEIFIALVGERDETADERR